MREPDLEVVNRTLSVMVQKQADELKQAEKLVAMLRRSLLTAADQLERAGWRQSAEIARDAAA